MKLKYELTFVDVGGDVMAVPVGSGADKFHGVIKLNSTAREILEMIADGCDSAEDAASRMAAKYPGDDPGIISDAVNEYFEKLKKAGLLVE